MDRDSTTNSLDSGANSSMNATDMTDGIHEASQQGEIAAGGTAKHMERGANSAMNATDLTDGIHEASHQGVCPFLRLELPGPRIPFDITHRYRISKGRSYQATVFRRSQRTEQSARPSQHKVQLEVLQTKSAGHLQRRVLLGKSSPLMGQLGELFKKIWERGHRFKISKRGEVYANRSSKIWDLV